MVNEEVMSNQIDTNITLRVMKIAYFYLSSSCIEKLSLKKVFFFSYLLSDSCNSPSSSKIYRMSSGALDFAFFSFAFHIYPSHFADLTSYLSSILIGLPASIMSLVSR